MSKMRLASGRFLCILILCFTFITITFGLDQDILYMTESVLTESIDATDVECFFDSLIESEMGKFHIPGVSFLLVQDSSILFSKGYGIANMDEESLVIPSKTVFYTGSVSKLFTATAIMQLAEQGKLQLDHDVNSYLEDFKIDDNFKEGVTIKNLLTHTGGFEEKNIGMAALSKEQVIPLKDFLSSSKQPRVLPPARYLSYSNYGYTLLGYLVEIISGMAFHAYVKENIFSPLGMHNSSFNYPKEAFSDLAFAYTYHNGKYTKMPSVYLNVGPAGSMLSTSTDMSKFMIAHLQNGSYLGKEILQPGTVDLMHSRLFSQHPEMAGWCYGFYERFVEDERIIEHAGDIAGYSSLLALIPEKKLGLFINYNGGEGMVYGFREKIIEEFIHNYFPASIELEEIAEIEIRDDIKRYSGRYRLNRYSRQSLEKLMAIVMEAKVEVLDSNSLRFEVKDFLKIPASTWVQVKPLLFKNPENGRFLSFMEDKNGKITHMNFRFGTPSNFEKIPWYAQGRFHLILLLVFLFIYLRIIPGWFISKLLKRIRNRKILRGITHRRTRYFTILVSSLNLLFLIGFPGTVAVAGQSIVIGVPWIIPVLLLIPFLSMICLGILIYLGIQNWRGDWTLSGRIQYISLIASSFVFFWFLNFWNLLGFNY